MATRNLSQAELPWPSPLALEAMGSAELDQLPVGVVELDAGGFVVQYNLTESRLSGLVPSDVVGRSFFAEVAPCTAVPEFEGRFREGVQQGHLDAEFEFEFNFVMVPVRVQVKLAQAPGAHRFWLMTFVLRGVAEGAQPGAESAWERNLDASTDLREMDEEVCAQERIEAPGRIQNFGGLIAVGWPSRTVEAADAGLPTFGLSAASLLGHKAHAVLPALLVDALERVGEAGELAAEQIRIRLSDRPTDALLHRWDDRVIIELVPAQDATVRLDRLLEDFDELQRAPVERGWSLACQHVARISGFDRVLGYQLTPAGDGTVVAEHLSGELSSLLGLSFPASDLPRQARKLFTYNRSRYCPNVHATPLELLKVADARPVDLSFSELRAPSPYHTIYQRNLGVHGSMSISLVVQGQLVGMLLCHHPRPWSVPRDQRIACVMLGRYLERVLQSALQREQDECRLKIGRAYTELVREWSSWDGLSELKPSILSAVKTIFDADGAAIRVGPRFWCTDEVHRVWAHRKLFEAPTHTVEFSSERADLEEVPPGYITIVPANGLALGVLAYREFDAPPRVWGRGPMALPGAIQRWEEYRSGVARPWTDLEISTAHQMDRDLKESLGPLLETRLLLGTIVSEDPVGVVLCDHRGKILDQNQFASELLGLDSAACQGRSLTEFIPDWDPSQSLAPELYVHSQPEGVQVPVRVTTKEHEGGQVRLVVFMQDLRAVRSLERQLRESKRMEEAATLATGLAHDFNNTLSVILNYGEMLLEDSEPHSESRSMLRDMVAATMSGKQIAHDMLTFARSADRDHERSTSVTHAFGESQRMLKAMVGRGRRLTLDVELQRDNVVALSRSELLQILFNLLGNAAHAARSFVRIEAYESKAAVKIVVRDDGPGIPESIRNEVFQPFFTTKARGVGTGLGLYVVAGLVKGAGGTITVHNDDGAVFSIELPTTKAKAQESLLTPDIPPRSTTDSSGASILLVEDNEMVRRSTARMLRRMGHAVTEAVDGVEGLSEFEACRPDILLTDLMMPAMSGAELIEAINDPSLPTVLCTGHQHGSALETLPGHVVILVKPHGPDKMRKALSEALERVEAEIEAPEDAPVSTPKPVQPS